MKGGILPRKKCSSGTCLERDQNVIQNVYFYFWMESNLDRIQEFFLKVLEREDDRRGKKDAKSLKFFREARRMEKFFTFSIRSKVNLPMIFNKSLFNNVTHLPPRRKYDLSSNDIQQIPFDTVPETDQRTSFYYHFSLSLFYTQSTHSSDLFSSNSTDPFNSESWSESVPLSSAPPKKCREKEGIPP